MADQKRILAWLVRLGMRCAPTKGEEDVTARVQDYVLGLKDLPDWGFSDASFESVSRLWEFFPAYAVLRRAIEQWLKRNPPPVTVPLLPGAAALTAALAAADLPGQDRCAVRLWIEHREKRDLPDKALTERLALIRRYHHAGYRWLTRANSPAGPAGLEAARIAAMQDWPDENPRPRESQDTEKPAGKDFEEIALARQKSSVPPAAMAKQRPPSAALDALADFEAKHGRLAGQLTAEQLRAARESSPHSKILLTPAVAPDRASDAPAPHDGAKPMPKAAGDPLEADSEGGQKSAFRPTMPWDDPQ